ncbi:putative RING-H2 finger protein ATL12 [Phragmites australis]|uniref:putative RING-H2 finger protein ATL12 n=1 Tax=Phragmites australis TaxID=29695 RepID=UPI002D7848BB|nr:putative RING-H2 finger protein ATL12 [Phragmites australis]
MARLALLAALVSAVACAAAAQPATTEAAPENPPGVGIKVSFRPSVVIVLGIFTMIFSLTFLLLMYAKFCHPSSSPLPASLPTSVPGISNDTATNQAGVPKPVIESLPFFRFATLRGARQGMECSVCLARFDDADLLRLLPRCRHAFHLDCVDRWLESNASCPLCRTRVDADDATLGLKYAASARIVFGGSDDTVGSGRDLLDIFVERVPSSRFLAGTDCKEEEEEQPPHMVSSELDRHKHRIIVSSVVFKSRWSELNSADLIALDTEMLRSMSSGRFFPSYSPEYNEANKISAAAEEEVDDVAATTIREETERKRLLGSKQHMGDGRGGGCSNSAAVDAVSASAARMISSGVRSVSEIVSLPRRRERLTEEGDRRWLPIARRTARWFAGRAKGEEEGPVHVVAAHV